MRRCVILFAFVFGFFQISFAQPFKDSIDEKQVAEILNFLSSDQLKGRGNFTPELTTATKFIGEYFSKNRLETFPSYYNYYQAFNAFDYKKINRDELKWNDKIMAPSRYLYLSADPIPSPLQLPDFRIIELEGPLPDSLLFPYWNDTLNILLWWKSSPLKNQVFELSNLILPQTRLGHSILLVSAKDKPGTLAVRVKDDYLQKVLFNVISVLPGRSRADEVIVFSAHYDHIGSNSDPGDNIFNGANDNASGTTAVLMLARYFAMRGDNERTIIFCLFAGEELGLVGSGVFAPMIKSQNVKAVINIEMVGKTGVTGKNAFCVIGAEYSNLESILKKNLGKDHAAIVKESSRSLFKRSDNYPFAVLGIPAHTIMCSDDQDPCYHKACDESDKIDVRNMTAVIKAIAVSCRTIINGEDTPARIKKIN